MKFATRCLTFETAARRGRSSARELDGDRHKRVVIEAMGK